MTAGGGKEGAPEERLEPHQLSVDQQRGAEGGKNREWTTHNHEEGGVPERGPEQRAAKEVVIVLESDEPGAAREAGLVSSFQ